MGLDAEAASLVGRLVATAADPLERDDRDRDGGDDDHGGSGPVDERSGKVRRGGFAPGEARVAGVLRKMFEGDERVDEAGVQQSAAADEGGEIADQPVQRRRGDDGGGERQGDGEVLVLVLGGARRGHQRANGSR